MKRSVLFLFLVSMLFALFACSGGSDNSDSQPQPPPDPIVPVDPTDPEDPTPPPADAIYIYDVQDLWDMAEDTANDGKYYYLANDIDLAGGQDNQWTPIGSEKIPFRGTFDGGGHRIGGVFINEPDEYYQGLFGYLSEDAVVKNLGVSVNITGYDYVGGIAGYSEGEISYCYSIGIVNADWYAGGIVGYNEGGIVSNNYSTGIVNADWVAGGIVGYNMYSTISNNYSAAVVSANKAAGGILGINGKGKVSNSYSTGDITATDRSAGGIVGGFDNGTISNCYSTGNITSSGEHAGGIAASYDGVAKGSISNCVALNGMIMSFDYAGRIIGYLGSGTFEDNYAYSGMSVSGIPVSGATGDKNGADALQGISTGQISNPDFWNGGAGKVTFDPETWDLDFTRAYKLPWLKNVPNPQNQPSKLPGHL